MTKLRNLLALTAASVFLLGAFTGCKKNTESPSPEPEAKTLESIILEVSPEALKVGGKAGLKVTATYSDKSTSDVSEKAVFTPSDTSVASVDGTTLTALKEGSVNVVASYKEGEKTVSSLSVSVEVSKADEPSPGPSPTPEPAAKTLVTVLLQTSPSPMNLLVNAKATLTATAEYSDGTTADVSDKATFSSSDTSVATIQGKTLTAVKAGTSKITATYKEGEIEKTSGESTVTVSNNEAEQPVFTLESIEAGEGFTLTAGEEKDITVTAKYKKKVGEVVTDESVTVTSDATFHSSVLSVAEFDGTYKNRLKALSAGITVITVNYQDQSKQHKSTTINVTVKEKPRTLMSIKLSVAGSDLFALTVGESKDLKVTATYSDGSTADVSSSATITSGSEHATVTGTKVTGVSDGEAQVTATFGGKTDSIKFTVSGGGTEPAKVKLKANYNAGEGNAIWFSGSFSESQNDTLIVRGLSPSEGGFGDADTTSWTLEVTMPTGSESFEWQVLLGPYGESGEKTKAKANLPDGFKYETLQGDTRHKYPSETEVTPDFTPKDAVILTVEMNVGEGNAIFFAGSFNESIIDNGSTGNPGWQKAIRGTYNDGNKWTVPVTMQEGKASFNWKPLVGPYNKGDTVDNINNSGLKWKNGDNFTSNTTSVTLTYSDFDNNN